ncbi:MAG: flavodoxin family protein [Desulfovibrio sp.]|nr:flavodoxin family protein [Desulfovibrio sp.]
MICKPHCIVYSSVTGNTQTLARFLAERLEIPLFSIAEAPNPENYACLILGFWVIRGMPDPRMLRFMQTVRGKTVFFFCTHAAWPDSEHIQHLRDAVSHLLQDQNNELLGFFSCQGRVHFSGHSAHHPMTPERKHRLEEAALHPNAEDCARALAALAQSLGMQ